MQLCFGNSRNTSDHWCAHLLGVLGEALLSLIALMCVFFLALGDGSRLISPLPMRLQSPICVHQGPLQRRLWGLGSPDLTHTSIRLHRRTRASYALFGDPCALGCGAVWHWPSGLGALARGTFRIGNSSQCRSQPTKQPDNSYKNIPQIIR